MKTKISFFMLIVTGVALMLVIGYTQGNSQVNSTIKHPVLNTFEVEDVLAESATCGGEIISDGGSFIVEKGVCWVGGKKQTAQKSTAQKPPIPTPAITDNKTIDGEGGENFSSYMSGLKPNTTYYVRAYATNSAGTKYGETTSFTTHDGVIIIHTLKVDSVLAESATCGGEIISDGDSRIIEKGVCWAIIQKQPGPKPSIPIPTIADHKTNDGEGYDSYISSINELSVSTKYYVRAYATNSVGTSYGNILSFTTQDGIAEIKKIEEIVILAATASFKISLTDGGAIINAKGVCWDSSKQTPSIIDNFTNNIEDTSNTFISNIKGLTPSTKYYVRAYATSRFGTVYGDTISFTTQPGIPDIDGNFYTAIVIGTQVWMVENLKVTHYRNGDEIQNIIDNSTWENLTTSAYCNYGNDINNADTYGRLYNWYAVTDNRNIAPTGWHVPTDAEWQILVDYLGGGEVAGGKMKEIGTTHWDNPNEGATNESGFSALPGGDRDSDGACSSVGSTGYWWSATENNSYSAWARDLEYFGSRVNRYGTGGHKRSGFSLRCVRD
ncbi:MAG: fibrobacter succinogenes major paralogous domain-containing protein [archaeon]